MGILDRFRSPTPKRESRSDFPQMGCPVRTSIHYPSGMTTARVIDWNDAKAVRAFSAEAGRILRRGGQTHAEALV